MREITAFNFPSSTTSLEILKKKDEKVKKKKMTKIAGTEKRCKYSNSEIVFEYLERIQIFEYPLTSLLILVIGKAQFRRAMLSCDSSCSVLLGIFGFFFTEMFIE